MCAHVSQTLTHGSSPDTPEPDASDPPPHVTLSHLMPYIDHVILPIIQAWVEPTALPGGAQGAEGQELVGLLRRGMKMQWGRELVWKLFDYCVAGVDVD